jgi:vacuolar-type H+-ATPase subunit I/STV1
MAADTDKRTKDTPSGGAVEGASQSLTGGGNPNQLVDELRQQITNLENKIRKVQGSKDSEVAQVRRENQQLEKRLEETNERLLEVIQDPAEREELRVQQMQAKLERYEAQQQRVQRLKSAKQFWIDKFAAVSESDLAEAETEEEVTALAQQAINKFISSREEGESGGGKETASEGDTTVLDGAGPSPDSETLDKEEYQRRVEELKNSEPDNSLRRGRNKGLEFLRLQREYLQGERSRKEKV